MGVLLVDAHPAIRRGIRDVLRGTEHADVVGEADGAEEALRLYEELLPEVVILDLFLEEKGDGIEVCRCLKSRPDPPWVVIYTARSSRESVAAASLAGADTYLHKGLSCEKLAEAVVRGANASERVWLLDSWQETRVPDFEAAVEEAGLTPREGEVLALLVPNHTDQEIARKLSLSRNTVKSHVRNVLKKMGVKSRRELSKWALSRDSSDPNRPEG